MAIDRRGANALGGVAAARRQRDAATPRCRDAATLQRTYICRHWQPQFQNAAQFESGVADAWPRLVENFDGAWDFLGVDGLETLGARVQAASGEAGRRAHPFADGGEGLAASFAEGGETRAWRTTIHGDLKAANVLVGPDDVALVDFQYVGDGLAATDLAHFLTASASGKALLGDDGGLRDDGLVDHYHDELVAGLVASGAAADADAARALAPRDVFQEQYDVAVVDKARYVFSYLWPRIDASPAELEAHATVANRNSYNKDVRAAAFLVKRVDAALRRRFPEVC